MAAQELMATAQRLNLSVDALAALGAELRARAEGIDVPLAVRERIAEVVDILGTDLLDGVSDTEMRAVADGIRSYFIQAAELLENPGRKPGWVFDDPVLLQSQGGASVTVAKLICQIVPTLEGLESRLNRGGSFLDVGTGVGLLGIEMAVSFPELQVVGIDPWVPALDLAHRNVEAAGVGHRFALREQRVEQITDDEVFDAVWLAGPFLGPEVTEPAIERSLKALLPGGWLFLGAYAGPDDPLAGSLAALRTVRSGGRVLSPDESLEALRQAGFADVHQIDRTWPAPVEFVVGRREVH